MEQSSNSIWTLHTHARTQTNHMRDVAQSKPYQWPVIRKHCSPTPHALTWNAASFSLTLTRFIFTIWLRHLLFYHLFCHRYWSPKFHTKCNLSKLIFVYPLSIWTFTFPISLVSIGFDVGSTVFLIYVMHTKYDLFVCEKWEPSTRGGGCCCWGFTILTIQSCLNLGVLRL